MAKLSSEGMASALSRRWLQSGIEHGDTVLVHSSIRRTLSETGAAPSDILDSFLNVIGVQGTLLLPLFNFDFTTGVPFDIRTSPSKMGALTEAGRLHPDAVRTGHPLYSFAAIGANAHMFEGIDNVSGYAEDSPFGMLRRMNGKVAILDLDDQNSMTFYHHVEEIKRVSYRYFKNFTASYTDAEGRASDRTYRLFVRDLEKGVVTNVNPAGELLWKENLYKGARPFTGAGLRAARAQDIYNLTSEIIDSGCALNMLYSIRT